MKIKDLSPFDSIPYFTIEAVRQLLGDESTAPGTIQTALYRWMKTGQVIQLKKGIYMARRFFELHRADANFAPMVSAILIPQSYLSLEFVLQRNAILTETTYPVSAVTLKQTRVFENGLGTYSYRNIKANLYTGFTLSNFLGISLAQATPAKALFDFFYFRPGGSTQASCEHIAEDLRLNLDDFSPDARREFAEWVELSQSRKLARIFTALEKTVWRP